MIWRQRVEVLVPRIVVGTLAATHLWILRVWERSCAQALLKVHAAGIVRVLEHKITGQAACFMAGDVVRMVVVDGQVEFLLNGVSQGTGRAALPGAWRAGARLA